MGVINCSCSTYDIMPIIESVTRSHIKMQNNRTEFVRVFKTGKIYELDMAANILEENNMPFYKQQDLSSGLRFAMPFLPVIGPGMWYSILVPKQSYEEAREILLGLPMDITTEPDVWHFGPTLKVKKWFIRLAWAYLFFMFFELLLGLYLHS